MAVFEVLRPILCHAGSKGEPYRPRLTYRLFVAHPELALVKTIGCLIRKGVPEICYALGEHMIYSLGHFTRHTAHSGKTALWMRW